MSLVLLIAVQRLRDEKAKNALLERIVVIREG
jgi:hypothetical protein